jgi:hypothetical protein
MPKSARFRKLLPFKDIQTQALVQAFIFLLHLNYACFIATKNQGSIGSDSKRLQGFIKTLTQFILHSLRSQAHVLFNYQCLTN